MKKFKESLKELIEKHQNEKGNPHIVIGVFSDAEGNLEAVVQKANGSFVVLRGLASILLEQVEDLIGEINEENDQRQKAASKPVIDLTEQNKEAFLTILNSMNEIDPGRLSDKMGFLHELKIKKDQLEDIKDKIQNSSMTVEERAKLAIKAEELLKEIADLFSKALNESKKMQDNVDDVLKRTVDLDKQSDIDEMMNQFGKSLQESDPDEDITDEDILS